MRIYTVVISILLVLCGLCVQAAPLLKAGDRLVFLGDSITEQQIYTRYVMNYFTLRYPGADISFRNAGWSGDRAPGGLNRLQRDVLSLKPTVVSICFGMNDGGYGAFNQGNYDVYMKGMTGLVAALKQANVKVVLLTPGAVDLDRNARLKGDGWNYNDTLEKYATGVKDLAAKEQLPVFDIHALMVDVQTKAKADKPDFTMIPDSVHPAVQGQAVMAYGLLKALGCDQQPSGLVIDAAKTAATPDRCKVENLKVAETEITFTRTDDALPTWFDFDITAFAKYLPLEQDLNQYPLKVTGLKAGNWKLTVEGQNVGEFTDVQLTAGVNLAGLPGPWQQLGRVVNQRSQQQESFYFITWRQFALASIPPEAKAEQDAAVTALNAFVAKDEAIRINSTTQRSWKWTLSCAPAAAN